MQVLLLAGFVGSILLDDGASLAPDGARGFGQGVESSTVLRVLRSSDDAARAFRSELIELPDRVRVAVDDLERPYRRLGYFTLVDDPDASVDDLHASFSEALRDPAGALAREPARAIAFGAMLVDVRFRVRLDLIRAARVDGDDLLGALALLDATAHGAADLSPTTILTLARRADVAASRLRSLEKDLVALRRATSGSGGTGKLVRELVDAAGADRDDTGPLDETLEHVDRQRATMARALFSTRLDQTLALELRWRGQAAERAARLAEQARELFPDPTDDGADEFASESSSDRTRRVRRALSLALEGLEFDPLDERLTWIAAETNDLVGGGADARTLFERYLALRGIRSWDDRSYRGRELSEREERALWVVQSGGAFPK